jgi:hypothetical protein
MPDRREVMLGNGQHTLYSDEVWYFVTAGDSGEVVLEVRFQSDAPGRTGYPTWAQTEMCVSQVDDEAIGRLHYGTPAEVLTARRPSFVPEAIWRRAVEECRGLDSSSGG